MSQNHTQITTYLITFLSQGKKLIWSYKISTLVDPKSDQDNLYTLPWTEKCVPIKYAPPKVLIPAHTVLLYFRHQKQQGCYYSPFLHTCLTQIYLCAHKPLNHPQDVYPSVCSVPCCVSVVSNTPIQQHALISTHTPQSCDWNTGNTQKPLEMWGDYWIFQILNSFCQ